MINKRDSFEKICKIFLSLAMVFSMITVSSDKVEAEEEIDWETTEENIEIYSNIQKSSVGTSLEVGKDYFIGIDDVSDSTFQSLGFPINQLSACVKVQFTISSKNSAFVAGDGAATLQGDNVFSYFNPTIKRNNSKSNVELLSSDMISPRDSGTYSYNLSNQQNRTLLYNKKTKEWWLDNERASRSYVVGLRESNKAFDDCLVGIIYYVTTEDIEKLDKTPINAQNPTYQYNAICNYFNGTIISSPGFYYYCKKGNKLAVGPLMFFEVATDIVNINDVTLKLKNGKKWKDDGVKISDLDLTINSPSGTYVWDKEEVNITGDGTSGYVITIEHKSSDLGRGKIVLHRSAADDGYKVTNNITDGTLSPTEVAVGEDYKGTITPATGKVLPATVTVNGKSYNVDENGSFTIKADDISRDFTVDGACHTHHWKYIGNNNVIKVYCDVEDGNSTHCKHNGESKAVTYTLSASNATYDGSEHGATAVNNVSAVTGDQEPDITYYDSIGSALTGAPKNAGTYTAKATINGATAEIEYIISKKSVSNVSDLIDFSKTESTSTYNGKNQIDKVIVEAKDGVEGLGVTVEYYKDGEVVKEIKDAGTYTVKVSTTGATNYENVTNYEVGTFTIYQKEVTVNGIKAKDKPYDGNTDAGLDYVNLTIDGNIDGNNLSATATGKFTDANKGDNKTVNISNINLIGKASSNYKLADSGNQTTATASITAQKVEIEFGTNSGGTYGGTITPATATVKGVPDVNPVLTYSGTADDGTSYDSVTEAPTKAGTYTVTATLPSDVTNYELKEKYTATFSVAKKEVTVKDIKANNKTFDNNTSADLDFSGVTIDGKVGSDKVSVQATGTFESASIGTNKKVTITSNVI